MKVLYFIAKYLVIIPFCKIFFWLNIEGKKNLPKKGGYILACNHQSTLDVIFLMCLCRHQVHFIAKKELFKNKFIAKILRGAGIIPVDRTSVLSGYSSLNEAIHYLKNDKVVAIFPQGTRCKGQNPMSTNIKSGVSVMAKWGNKQVVPIFIKTKGYKTKLFHKASVFIGQPITYQDDPNKNQIENYRIFAKDVMLSICSFDNTNNEENNKS
jgi:1-acyl-sn-glycerol-3-phosphate acyltransferase